LKPLADEVRETVRLKRWNLLVVSHGADCRLFHVHNKVDPVQVKPDEAGTDALL
jgi:hypothetical protein